MAVLFAHVCNHEYLNLILFHKKASKTIQNGRQKFKMAATNLKNWAKFTNAHPET